jgi:hypothetical protein
LVISIYGEIINHSTPFITRRAVAAGGAPNKNENSDSMSVYKITDNDFDW